MRTLSVASTACVSPESVGIQASLCSARSSPVTTATTPGSSLARDVSIELIFACAKGLRRIAMCSMFGSVMSSM